MDIPHIIMLLFANGWRITVPGEVMVEEDLVMWKGNGEKEYLSVYEIGAPISSINYNNHKKNICFFFQTISNV